MFVKCFSQTPALNLHIWKPFNAPHGKQHETMYCIAGICSASSYPSKTKNLLPSLRCLGGQKIVHESFDEDIGTPDPNQINRITHLGLNREFFRSII